MSLIVCIPVTAEGELDPRWGRADRVAIVNVSGESIESWSEFEVGWGRLHDSGPEGAHHARVASFLREHAVEVVVADHMGPPMAHMLDRMGIEVRLGANGIARDALVNAARKQPPDQTET